MYSGRLSWISGRHSCKALAISLFMTFPVIPAFFSRSVEVYTPVITPLAAAPCAGPAVPCGCAAPGTVAPPTVPGWSISGCTMFTRPLKAVGFPKNRNVLPGCSRSAVYLIPLKNTNSIVPVPSCTHTLSFFPWNSLEATVAWICTNAASGTTSAIGTTVLRSMYRNGYSRIRSPIRCTSSSLRSSAARFGPTPGRYWISDSNSLRSILYRLLFHNQSYRTDRLLSSPLLSSPHLTSPLLSSLHHTSLHSFPFPINPPCASFQQR